MIWNIRKLDGYRDFAKQYNFNDVNALPSREYQNFLDNHLRQLALRDPPTNAPPAKPTAFRGRCAVLSWQKKNTKVRCKPLCWPNSPSI